MLDRHRWSPVSVRTDHLQLFRLWLGVTEYLFRNPELLDEALDTAIDDNTFRSDDLEFTFAARVSLTSLYTYALTFSSDAITR